MRVMNSANFAAEAGGARDQGEQKLAAIQSQRVTLEQLGHPPFGRVRARAAAGKNAGGADETWLDLG